MCGTFRFICGSRPAFSSAQTCRHSAAEHVSTMHTYDAPPAAVIHRHSVPLASRMIAVEESRAGVRPVPIGDMTLLLPSVSAGDTPKAASPSPSQPSASRSPPTPYLSPAFSTTLLSPAPSLDPSPIPVHHPSSRHRSLTPPPVCSSPLLPRPAHYSNTSPFPSRHVPPRRLAVRGRPQVPLEDGPPGGGCRMSPQVPLVSVV